MTNSKYFQIYKCMTNVKNKIRNLNFWGWTIYFLAIIRYYGHTIRTLDTINDFFRYYTRLSSKFSTNFYEKRTRINIKF